MPKLRSILLGKLVLALAALRGGGSALPGLVIERTDKDFLYDCLSGIPKGIIVVSGTNGKTTTTKIVVELLKSQGLNVFTNRTGSNLLRGIIAELIREISLGGKLGADIAVLELDEAHATHFVNIIPPKYSLLLNVFDDQTERLGGADQTALLLARIADKTTDCIITSRDDPRLACLEADTKIVYFGASPGLAQKFHPENTSADNKRPGALVVFNSLSNGQSEFTIAGKNYSTPLSLSGIYNSLNAAAALTLIKTILPDSDTNGLLSTLKNIHPADGRGEIFTINGTEVQLLLVKNAAGFNLTLPSSNPESSDHMIVTNNAIADGTDISWLSDVDFSVLRHCGVAVVSGTCADFLSNQLKDQNITVAKVDPNPISAVNNFIISSKKTKRIFCSYTAMSIIRKHLVKCSKKCKCRGLVGVAL